MMNHVKWIRATRFFQRIRYGTLFGQDFEVWKAENYKAECSKDVNLNYMINLKKFNDSQMKFSFCDKLFHSFYPQRDIQEQFQALKPIIC